MTTEVIQIIVSETGSRTVKRNLQDLGESAGGAHSAVEMLRTALASIGVGLGLRELQEYVDAFTQITNRIKLVTSNTAELNAVEEQLFQNAQETRTAIEPLSQLYVRLGRAAGSLGASQKNMLDFTKGVGIALALTGTSSNEARGALLQLSQAMGAGTVRAQDFNSVLEQAPSIAQAVAQGMTEMAQTAAGQEVLGRSMDRTSLSIVKLGLNVASLRGLVDNGKISSELFFKAFLTQLPKMQQEFAKTAPTIGQAFVELENSFIKLIGQENTQRGISATLATGLINLAHVFDEDRKAVAALGAALLVAFTPSLLALIGRIIAAIYAFTAASLANPFIAAATAIGAAVAALSVYKDDIVITAQGHITLGDYARAAWSMAKDAISAAIPFVEQWWQVLLEKIPLIEQIGSVLMDALTEATAFLKNWLNFWIGFWVGVVKSTLAAWDNFPAALKDFFTQAINGAIQIVQDGLNNMVHAINSVAALVHIKPIADFSLGQLSNNVDGAATQLAETVKKAFGDALGTDYVQKALDGVTTALDKLKAKAAEAAQARQSAAASAAAGTAAPVDLSAAPAGKFQLSADQTTQLKSLRDSLDGVFKATNEVGDSERLLGLAMRATNINASEHAKLIELLKLKYRDAMDPLAAINREIQRQTALLDLDKDHRDAADKAYQYSLQLQKAGVVLSKQQIQTLADSIFQLGQATQVTEKYDQALETANGPLRDLTQKQEALNVALSQGRISTESFARQWRDAQIDFLDTQNDFGSGVERGLLKLQRGFSDFASQSEQVVTDAFGGMEDAVGQFAKTGQLDVSNLITSILADFAKLAFRQTIEQPLMSGLMAVLPQVLHSGGVAGMAANDNMSRVVPLDLYKTAPRFHNGLMSDEVAAILRRGEVVLNQGQQQALGAAMADGGPITVNVIDQTNSGVQVKATASRDGRGGKQLDLVIQEAAAKGIRTPGSPINKALRDTFGAQQRVISR